MKTVYKEYRKKLKETENRVAEYAITKGYNPTSFWEGYLHCIRAIRAGKEQLHLIKPKELTKSIT